MGKTYSVTINNRASHSDYFMVFQNDLTNWAPNAMALAWFSKYSNPSPTTELTFEWTVDVGFSWAETGELQPGIRFNASEKYIPENGLNKITLDYNGGYLFTGEEQGPDKDRLYLSESGNIPLKSLASVGVTMAGSTVFATQARPNQSLTFSPHPRYFIAYGNYQKGEVIDVSAVNNPLELVYPTGVYSLTTTLNVNGTWDTSPTSCRSPTRSACACFPADPRPFTHPTGLPRARQAGLKGTPPCSMHA